MKKRICLIFVLLTFLFSSSAEELNNFNTSWNCVITGNLICKPVKTSYGFSLINDARMIQTFSDSGKLLWEKSVGRVRNPELKVLPEDFFLLFSSDNTEIKLINPSGVILWEKNLDSSIISVLPGRDGRFFLSENNFIKCFGITGIEKWSLSIDELSEINSVELPDGTFIAFLKNPVQNQTKALRINPFGDIVEEILFSNIVDDAKSLEKGVLVHFINGECGYFTLSEDLSKSENKWLVKNDSQSSKSKIVTDGKKIFYLLQSSNQIKINELDKEDGKVLNLIKIEDMNISQIKLISVLENGFFIFDGLKSNFITFSGQTLFEGKISSDVIFSNYLFSNQNYLVLFKDDWSINAYKITEKIKSQSADFEKQKNYSDFYKNNYSELLLLNAYELDSDLTSNDKLIQLSKGNYGNKEIEWLKELEFYSDQYIAYIQNKSRHSDSTVFDFDSSGVEKMILQMSYYSSNQFSHKIAVIIKKSQINSEIAAALSGTSINGYDSDGEILSAIESLNTRIKPNDEAVIRKICDSVYSITSYMGRPAFNTKGKKILSEYLYPSYSDKTRKYVRLTLKKITELDL